MHTQAVARLSMTARLVSTEYCPASQGRMPSSRWLQAPSDSGKDPGTTTIEQLFMLRESWRVDVTVPKNVGSTVAVLKFLNFSQFNIWDQTGVHEISAMCDFCTRFPNSLSSLNFQPGMFLKSWKFQPGRSSAPDSTVRSHC